MFAPSLTEACGSLSGLIAERPTPADRSMAFSLAVGESIRVALIIFASSVQFTPLEVWRTFS